MDKVRAIVTTVLHTLDDAKVKAILAALVDLGVDCEADLLYVLEDDLKDILKPIQIRKLIATFNRSSSSTPEAAVPSYFPREIPFQEASCSPTKNVQNKNSLPSNRVRENSVQDTSSVPPASNLPGVDSEISRIELLEKIVHWEKMPAAWIEALRTGEVLEPIIRREIVRLIADDILSVIAKPIRQEINMISEHIVKQFRSLGDVDSVGGQGFNSLSSQIAYRIDNLRRSVSSNRLRSSDIPRMVPAMAGPPTTRRDNHYTIIPVSCSQVPPVSPVPAKSTALLQVSPLLEDESNPQPSPEDSRLHLLKNVVKWEKMPLSLVKALQSGNPLSKAERYQIVTLVANDILQVLKQPKRHEIYLISEHIVKRYKCLQDQIEGSLVGSGHDFFFNQIFSKVEYLKRNPLSNSKPSVNADHSSEIQILESENSVCVVEFPNVLKHLEVEESVSAENDQLEELSNCLLVHSHEVKTLIAQTYSVTNSVESLKATKDLMCELTKSFVTDSGGEESSVANSNINLTLPATRASLSSLSSPKKISVFPQSRSPTSVHNIPQPANNVKTGAPMALENVVNWKRVPITLMEQLENGNVLKPRLRLELVRIIAEDILHAIPHPRRREIYIIARSCVKQYKSLEDKIGNSVVGNGCDLLCSQVQNRIDNIRRKAPVPRVGSKRSAHNGVNASYGCKNWSPSFPPNETEGSLKAKQEVLLKLSKCFMISSCELERLIASTYYCQRMTINFRATVSSMLSKWPLLFSDTGMLEHFKILTGVNLLDQMKSALTLKGKQIMRFMSCLRYNEKVITCLEKINAVQKNENSSEVFSLLMVLSSYFDEDVSTLMIQYEADDSSNIGRLNVPLIPCLIAVGKSLLVVDHYMLVCDGIILNKNIEEDLIALCMLFASYFVLNFRYPKSNRNVLEFIQRCLVGINPPNGTKVEGGKNMVNRNVLRLCNRMNDATWMEVLEDLAP